MLTKELARRFCAHWNAAKPGDVITIYSDGTINNPGAGRHPWIEIERDDGQLDSTAEAFDWIQKMAHESIAGLNMLGQ